MKPLVDKKFFGPWALVTGSCKYEPGYKCSGQPSVCTPTTCGNGKKEGAETCDDGNTIPFDGCSATCQAEPDCSTHSHWCLHIIVRRRHRARERTMRRRQQRSTATRRPEWQRRPRRGSSLRPPAYGYNWVYDTDIVAIQPPAKLHDFSFTSHVVYWFKYDATQSATLGFTGDDDVWVFINQTLAVDLGGLHTPLDGSVTISAATAG